MRTYGTVQLAKRHWVITAEPQVILRLKRIFPRISHLAHGSLKLLDTLETCRDLAWALERFPMAVTPADYLAERARTYTEQGERLLQVLSGNYTPRAFDLALPLRPYQQIAAEVTLQRGNLLVADDVGLGKSATAIGVLADPRCRPALVVTLTHLPRQWAAEIGKFTPDLRVHCLTKAHPYALPDPTPDVIVSNYHKLSGWADHLAGRMRAVVFDEIQELRRPKSGKYAAAEHLAHRAEVRMGLSATPIFNMGAEMYHVLSILDPLALGTFEEFLTEWCELGWGGPDRARIGDPAAFGSYLRDQGLMLRRTRAEVGRELPDVITVTQEVDTEAAPLQAVEGVAEELARIILVQGGQTVKGEKLRAAEELSWRLRQATGIAKAPHVADFVQLLVESGEQVVLFGWHREVYSIWLERLDKYSPRLYTGTESPAAKHAAVTDFRARKSQVLCMSLRAGAGLEGLQEAAHVAVFGELDWSPGVHEQCIGRLQRDGQAEPVVAYYLVADTGSDPVVADVLGLKRQQIAGIRDPHAALVEKLQGTGDHIQRLAEAYLRQRGRPLPAARTPAPLPEPLLVTPPAAPAIVRKVGRLYCPEGRS